MGIPLDKVKRAKKARDTLFSAGAARTAAEQAYLDSPAGSVASQRAHKEWKLANLAVERAGREALCAFEAVAVAAMVEAGIDPNEESSTVLAKVGS